MDKKVLEFDEKIVEKSEIANQVKNYIDECEKGLSLLSKGDSTGALNILNDIQDSLKIEYNYYSKTKIQHIIFVNKDYNDYNKAIFSSLSSEVDNNSETLENTFKEIENNMKLHCGYLLSKEIWNKLIWPRYEIVY